MAGNRLVFWEHGTLLQPQHFQCLEERLPDLGAILGDLASPWPWGVRELAIQEEALNLSHFVVDKLDLVLPGGEHAVLGRNAIIATRSFDGLWEEQEKPLEVRIGLAPMLENEANVTELDLYDPAACLAASTRFVAGLEPVTMPDRLAGNEPADVRFMAYNLRLVFGTESDLLASMPTLPLARLVREGENIRLDPEYCPPCVSLDAAPALASALKAVRNAVIARASQLEDFKILPGLADVDSLAGKTAVTAQTLTIYSMLGVLCRHAPMLDHYCETPNLHPWLAYGLLRQIAGELSLFSADISAIGTSRGGERTIPPYDHLDPAPCFAAAQLVITRLVDTLAAGPAHNFVMENNGPLWFCRLPAFARTGFDFWLQVHSPAPDEVRNKIALASKFAPENMIQALVARSLPGIRLFVADQPPPGLPRRDDICYFAIDRTDPLWGVVMQTGDPALFVGELPVGTSMRLLLMAATGPDPVQLGQMPAAPGGGTW